MNDYLTSCNCLSCRVSRKVEAKFQQAVVLFRATKAAATAAWKEARKSPDPTTDAPRSEAS